MPCSSVCGWYNIVQYWRLYLVSINILQAILNNLKLALNPHKTKFMLFLRARDNASKNFYVSTLQGSNIERVTVYKFPGIWLDDILFQISGRQCCQKITAKIKQIFLWFVRKGLLGLLFSLLWPMVMWFIGTPLPLLLKPWMLFIMLLSGLLPVMFIALFIKSFTNKKLGSLLYLSGGIDTCICLFIKALIGKLPSYNRSMLFWSFGAYQTWSNNWLAFSESFSSLSWALKICSQPLYIFFCLVGAIWKGTTLFVLLFYWFALLLQVVSQHFYTDTSGGQSAEWWGCGGITVTKRNWAGLVSVPWKSCTVCKCALMCLKKSYYLIKLEMWVWVWGIRWPALFSVGSNKWPLDTAS